MLTVRSTACLFLYIDKYQYILYMNILDIPVYIYIYVYIHICVYIFAYIYIYIST